VAVKEMYAILAIKNLFMVSSGMYEMFNRFTGYPIVPG